MRGSSVSWGLIVSSALFACSSGGSVAPGADGGGTVSAGDGGGPGVTDGAAPGPGSEDAAAAPDSGTGKGMGGPDAGAGDAGSTVTSFDAGPITGLIGNTYYVAPTGSDANAGSSTAPWLTIQHAGPTLKPGDTLVVRAGTYAGAVFGYDDTCAGGVEDCVIAGTATNPILIEADPAAAPGSVIIGSKNGQTESGLDLQPGCDYVDIVGFRVTNGAGTIDKAGIAVAQSKGNRILGNTIDLSGGTKELCGILVDVGDGVVVEGNTVSKTQSGGDSDYGHGMYISGSSVNVSVVGNVVHDNDYVGIHLNGDISEQTPGATGVLTGILIAGNVLYANGQNGINADGLQSSTIENNVIYGNSRGGIALYQSDALGGSTGNVIVNNTIDESMGETAIAITACTYDNQSVAPTPAGCSTASADTSTGNIAFDNIAIGGKSGAITFVSMSDVATSTNISAAAAGLFVDSASGNYTLAPGGPAIGAGIASFDNAAAPPVGGASASYDIGAFAFAQ